MFRAGQVSQARLFLNGQPITDQAILNTHTQEGDRINRKHYVTIGGVKTQVFKYQHFSRSRLFHNGQPITDPTILATYTEVGKWPTNKHYVMINNIKTQVFTYRQHLAQIRLLQKDQPTDPVTLLSKMSTAAQISDGYLFLNGQRITDPAVLSTHRKEIKGTQTKHFVTIDNVKTEIQTARKRNRILRDENERPNKRVHSADNELTEEANPVGSAEMPDGSVTAPEIAAAQPYSPTGSSVGSPYAFFDLADLDELNAGENGYTTTTTTTTSTRQNDDFSPFSPF
ncbi:hypothetical protein [Legionella sp. 29fVS95]|uniref:hypothetical protein n=1 Tax=Legionella sp. 29fVS95 TaxID=3402813 RepID=UPI003AF858D0